MYLFKKNPIPKDMGLKTTLLTTNYLANLLMEISLSGTSIFSFLKFSIASSTVGALVIILPDFHFISQYISTIFLKCQQ